MIAVQETTFYPRIRDKATGAIQVQERERVDGSAALLPAPAALAGCDEAGEREAAERDASPPHVPQQREGRGVEAAAHAAGDGRVPGGRRPARHLVEQAEGGVRGRRAAAEVEGQQRVAVEGAERERAAEGEAVDGAREERVVREEREARARERRDGGVRVGGEGVEG